MYTPGFPLLLSSHMSGQAAAGLARDLAAAGRPAAVSQAALDAGVRDVVLYTDLANPTSNALYQRLGYRPVEDRVVLSFAGDRALSLACDRGGLRFTRERT